MVKKAATHIGTLLLALCCLLASCNWSAAPASSSSDPASSAIFPAESLSTEERGRLDKFYQIESGWTEEQVCALVGEPDEHLPTSASLSELYDVTDTIQVVIQYWLSDGAHVIAVSLVNSQTGESSSIVPLQVDSSATEDPA